MSTASGRATAILATGHEGGRDREARPHTSEYAVILA